MVDRSRRRARPLQSWKHNIKEGTGQAMLSLLRIADDRSRWAAITAEASVGVPQRRPGVTGISHFSVDKSANEWLTSERES